LFHDLAGGPVRSVAAAAAAGDPDGQVGLARRLSELSTVERDQALVAFVRVHAAEALGHPDDAEVSPARAFKELGFDSLTAVELRNRLNVLTGLRLPTTLVFDHPTPGALARYLRDQLFPAEEGPAGSGESEDDTRIRQILAAIPISRLHRTGVLDLILELADSDLDAESPVSPTGVGAGVGAAGNGPESIDDMDAESLLRLATETR
jgi:acyl carrier protein